MLRRRPERELPGRMTAVPLAPLLDQVRTHRRRDRRRRRVLAAAAGVLVLALGGVAALDVAGGGTDLQVSVRGLDGPGPFTLLVLEATGAAPQAATWGGTAAGAAAVTGASSFSPEEITLVQVVDGDGTVLARG